MVIQHNIPALNSHRNLGVNNSKAAKNLEKLSSGYRINRAGDDAAGLAISEKMRGQISGLGMAEQNANNGISLIQTAEGGLNETHSILQRMRELAVQSSNGTYQDSDRELIELEYQALKQEIDRIASYTNYNGIKLLDGTVGGVMLSNTSAAEQMSGTEAELRTIMGIGAALTNGTVAAQGTLTARSKNFTQDLSGTNTQRISGFDNAINDLNVSNQAVVNGPGGANANSFNIDAHVNFTLTKTDGGWDVKMSIDDASTASQALKDAKATFSTGTTSLLTITYADGSKHEIDLGEYDPDHVGHLGAAAPATAPTAGGYATNSTISLDMTYKTDGTGQLTVTNSKATVRAETVEKRTVAVTNTANTTLGGELTYSWDNKNKAWNISGDVTFTNTVTGIAETIKMMSTFKPNGTTAPILTGTTEHGDEVQITLTAANFTAPTDANFAAGGFTTTISGGGGGMVQGFKVGTTEAYRYDAPGTPSPDQERADKMLKAMGLSNASKFDINMALKNGTTAEKLIWESLNNKDAYIITRDSTADTDRNKFNAKSEYETVLQVNGQSFLGKQEGTDMNFYTADGKTKVATLSFAGQATETGTVRFNTGDKNSQYYDSFLLNKEGAQIGSENVSNLVFQIGANGTEDQRIGMYVFNMSSDNIGNHEKGNFVSMSSIITRDEANVAVDTLDNAISYVVAQRSNLGALQNRLEHTLNNLGVTKENLTAAESSIRDVDMAKEMMDFTKNNILVQASQAMLAQANSLPQGVLSLLR